MTFSWMRLGQPTRVDRELRAETLDKEKNDGGVNRTKTFSEAFLLLFSLVLLLLHSLDKEQIA